MRPRMTSFWVLMYCGRDTTSATWGRFSIWSMYWLASTTARMTAFTVLGFFAANSSVKPSTFRMVEPHLLRGDGRETDAISDGSGVPRLTHTKTVHFAHLH